MEEIFILTLGFIHGQLVYCYGPTVKQSIMLQRAWWSRPTHLMATGKEKREKEKDKKEKCFQGMFPVTHFFQMVPTSYSFHYLHKFLLIVNSPVVLSTDEVIALMSRYFPVAPPLKITALGSKPSTQEPIGNIPDPNHNGQPPQSTFKQMPWITHITVRYICISLKRSEHFADMEIGLIE